MTKSNYEQAKKILEELKKARRSLVWLYWDTDNQELGKAVGLLADAARIIRCTTENQQEVKTHDA